MQTMQRVFSRGSVPASRARKRVSGVLSRPLSSSLESVFVRLSGHDGRSPWPVPELDQLFGEAHGKNLSLSETFLVQRVACSAEFVAASDENAKTIVSASEIEGKPVRFVRLFTDAKRYEKAFPDWKDTTRIGGQSLIDLLDSMQSPEGGMRHIYINDELVVPYNENEQMAFKLFQRLVERQRRFLNIQDVDSAATELAATMTEEDPWFLLDVNEGDGEWKTFCSAENRIDCWVLPDQFLYTEANIKEENAAIETRVLPVPLKNLLEHVANNDKHFWLLRERLATPLGTPSWDWNWTKRWPQEYWRRWINKTSARSIYS